MHGYFVDQSFLLSDAQDLPNTTSLNSEAVYLGNHYNPIDIKLFAHNMLCIPEGFTLDIEIEVSDDNETFSSPIKNGHLLLVHHTAGDKPLIYHPGEELLSIGLSPKFINGWVRLKYTTNKNLCTSSIDAFCCFSRPQVRLALLS